MICSNFFLKNAVKQNEIFNKCFKKYENLLYY